MKRKRLQSQLKGMTLMKLVWQKYTLTKQLELIEVEIRKREITNSYHALQLEEGNG